MAANTSILMYLPSGIYFIVYLGALTYVFAQPRDSSSAKSRAMAGLILHLVMLFASQFISFLVVRFAGPDQVQIVHGICLSIVAVLYSVGMILIVSAVFVRSSLHHVDRAEQGGGGNRTGSFDDGNPYSPPPLR